MPQLTHKDLPIILGLRTTHTVYFVGLIIVGSAFYVWKYGPLDELLFRTLLPELVVGFMAAQLIRYGIAKRTGILPPRKTNWRVYYSEYDYQAMQKYKLKDAITLYRLQERSIVPEFIMFQLKIIGGALLVVIIFAAAHAALLGKL